MIYIECTYCGQKIYTLKNKYCTYCHTSIRNEVYRIKKIQDIYNVNKKIQKKNNIYNKDFLKKIYQEKVLLENEVSENGNITKVIIIAIGLMVVAVLLPIILGLIGSNNIKLNPSIITLLTVLLPIVSIIGVIIFFIPINRNE